MARRKTDTETTEAAQVETAEAPRPRPEFGLPRGFTYGPRGRGYTVLSGHLTRRADGSLGDAHLAAFQAQVGIEPTGLWGDETTEAVQAIQAELGQDEPTGLLDPETWAAAWARPAQGGAE